MLPSRTDGRTKWSVSAADNVLFVVVVGESDTREVRYMQTASILLFVCLWLA